MSSETVAEMQSQATELCTKEQETKMAWTCEKKEWECGIWQCVEVQPHYVCSFVQAVGLDQRFARDSRLDNSRVW